MIATLIWQASIIAISRWTAFRHGASWWSLGLKRPFSWLPKTDWARVIRIAIFALVAAEAITILYQVIAKATGLDALQPQQQLPEKLFTVPWLTALTGFTVVLTAPIAEEILFRGTIFAGLRSSFGFWPAAFVSSAIFAAAHAQSGLIIPFTLVGMTLAYVYQRTGSIFVNMSVHCTFNLLSFVALLLVPGAR
jgi:membrane protease YdiL (CAAX protease family)